MALPLLGVEDWEKQVLRHVSTKSSVRHPGSNVKLTVGSVNLTFRRAIWARGTNQ